MKSLFIECNMGIAGDMLNAALWELIADKEGTLQEIKKIGIPKTNICFEKAVTCGISGTSAKVIIDGWEEGNPYPSGYDSHHKHKSLSEMNSIIDGLNVSNSVKEKSKSVYSIIANAESKVHNADVSAVHFHELGMLDAIADVVVSSFLIDKLRLERITVSPINVGSGSVKCAHGVLPVPAPAAAEILKGVPYYKSEIKGELCTPTGAALIKAFADEFSQMPTMTVEKIGYGIGSKKFEQANFVRAFYGECEKGGKDSIIELVCNIDDMTAEELAFAVEILLKSGAVDVYTQPAYMKKSRLGTVLTVLCRKESRQEIISLIFKHTSTIGIREHICSRYVLDRKTESVSTPFGNIRAKMSYGYGNEKRKFEFEDLKQLAIENNISVSEIKNIIKNCK